MSNIRISQILLKRGNSTASSGYVGPLGEITIDTTLKTLRIHDGVHPGGNIVGGSGNVVSFNQSLNTTDAVSFDSVGATVGFIAQINGTNPGQELVIQAGGSYNWTFHGNGGLEFPDNSVQNTAYRYTASTNAPTMTTGALWFNSTDGRLYVNYNNTWVDASPTEIDPSAIRFNEQNQIELPNGGLIGDTYNDGGLGIQAPPGSYAIINSNNQQQFVEADDSAVYIGTSWPDNYKIWTFETDGNLRLPPGGDIIDSNGSSVLGGGASTGQWAFDGDTAYNNSSNGLYIQPGQGNADGSIYIPTTEEGSDLSIINNSGGAVTLSTNNKSWTFGMDGNLTIPGDIVYDNGASILSNYATISSTLNTSSTSQSTNDFVGGNYYNADTLSVEYTAYTGSSTLNFNLGYQKPLDGNIGISVAAVSTPIIQSLSNIVMTSATGESLSVASNGDVGATTTIGWYENINSTGNLAVIGMNALDSGGVGITTGNQNTTIFNWVFNKLGQMNFPGGGLLNVKSTAPTHSYGVTGDQAGMIAFDNDYFYYCKTDYVNNSTDIWVRVVWTSSNW